LAGEADAIADLQFLAAASFDLAVEFHIAILNGDFRHAAGIGQALEFEELVESERTVFVG
jgi:hypothetical protein